MTTTALTTTPTATTMRGLAALQERISGELVQPADDRWGEVTQAFNLVVSQRPAVVAIPADAQDVVAIVEFARTAGMQIAPQRTGHNAEPLGAMDDVILVRTDALRGVEIDAEKRIAYVRAGSKWADVVPAASELGLAALHGSTPDVSVAGYSLGGGVGWYGRKHGLSANSVVAIEVVTPDGRLRHVDAEHDAELFWALRGGGGSFGVVTALTIRLYPIAEVYAGALFFPWERASEVLHAWRRWTATVPDEVTSVGRILRFPPIPDVPEPLRGRNFAVVEAVVIADESAGAKLLAPLRELEPELDTFAMMPPVGIAELHMDPPEPVPYQGAGQILGSLTDEAIDAFIAVAGPDSGSPLVSAEIRHVGGAFARPEPGQGALGTLDGAFLTFAVGMVLDAESRRGVSERLALLEHALAPYDTGRRYLNFTDRPTDPARFYTPATYQRLRLLKAVIDSDNVMRANHTIPPAC